MTVRKLPLAGLFLCLWALGLMMGHAQTVVINEILLNPPGNPDYPNEYIELRGVPNFVLPDGTYLVSVEGDTNANPGTIQDIFDLSGQALGGNGFLVILQKTNDYVVNVAATTLQNTDSGTGWGSGSSSSIGHRGENGQTELENGSQTFFLIQTTNAPVIGSDIDTNDDGVPDAPFFASWAILDSVGLLDNDGLGDIAYGAITFRRNSAAKGSGVIVPVNFTPSYLGRSGNTIGAAAAAWVASDNIGGTAPNWTLGGSANTVPVGFAGLALNHLGGPNFGASAIPGVIVMPSGGSTTLAEGSGTAPYTIALNVTPGGNVVIQFNAAAPLQISTDGGATFGNSRSLTFSSTAAKTVLVRAVDDNVVDTTPYFRAITHTIASTGDPARYPLSTLIPPLTVQVTEKDSILLSELKVNPPGPSDDPYEFIEIEGRPGALLTNVYLLAIEGNVEKDPGRANLVVNLSGTHLGTNGLMLVLADGHPYSVPFGCSVVIAPQLNTAGGALGNGTISFLLLTSPSAIIEGNDLDNGNNGILEGLPDHTIIMDSVSWSDGDTNDLVYSAAVLTQTSGTPDAATRFSGDKRPNETRAWFNGDLAGSTGESLLYDNKNISTNFPLGTTLTPGAANNTAPSITPIQPLSGVIGDPTNPTATFVVDDAESGPNGLMIAVHSSNPLVVPDANLNLTAGPGGARMLGLNPVGVGYATIHLTVSDGAMTRRISFDYAASAMGRANGRFLTGMSDGSTAIAIDAQYMFVGDDENQVLRLYRRDQSGPPVSAFDCGPFLGLTDIENGVPREVDIEGSTRVGQRLFWIGSHSHAEIGEVRTNRSRLFTTDISGTGVASTLAYVGRYEHLKMDLVNWDHSNAHGRGADYFGLAASTAEGVLPKEPDGSGFNIEGLAMAPGSTNVGWIGFRAPLVPASNRVHALIVPVLNFDKVAVGNGPAGSAIFGTPIELPLGCRGIRSIEGDTNGYLIVAGPAGNPVGLFPQDFKLFTWSGDPTEAPQERAADLRGMKPEGIVELPPPPRMNSSLVQLISDNGTTDYYGDGLEAKKLPEPNFKKFRMDWVTLGPVVDLAPSINAIRIAGNIVTLGWCALPGRTYRIEYKAALNAENWTTLDGDVLATSAIATKTDPLTPGQRFYRVLLLP